MNYIHKFLRDREIPTYLPMHIILKLSKGELGAFGDGWVDTDKENERLGHGWFHFLSLLVW